MSDSGNVDLRRQTSRRRYVEKAVLTAALCRELEDEAKRGDFPSERSEAAYKLLSEWGERQDAEGDLDLNDVAPELRAQIYLGARVYSDLSMVYSAGAGMEYERDVESLHTSLATYLARDN
ncbi:MAG: hypothetical protein ACOYEV_08920 [Candidatus Nanopelagicales bacterium]